MTIKTSTTLCVTALSLAAMSALAVPVIHLGSSMTPFVPGPQHNYPDNSPAGFYRRGLTQNTATIPLFLHVTSREAHDITERDYHDMLYEREFAFDELD